MNSAIRKLEAEGVLYLEKTGGKAKTARLTDAGQTLAQGTAMRILNIENDIFACWPAQEVQDYLRLTETFLNDLRERTARL